MPSHPPRPSHLATLLRWPLGVILTSWRYMWRTTPMSRRERRGSPGRDAAPELSAEVRRDGLQLVADGAGPAFHRRYRARIAGARCSPEQLVTALREDPNRVAPTEFAHFERGDDASGWLRPGDELLVRMPGPWNGPVRVVHASPSAFADPQQVRALYDADAPLEGRNMLLEVRFRGLRLRFGVRVGEVLDEVREVDGRRVHVWGWGYRTLEGHLEEGRMDYEVWRWEDTGEVEFAIHVVSRRARAGNPILRMGFRLFGRREQVRFADRACERMVQLTARRASAQPAA